MRDIKQYIPQFLENKDMLVYGITLLILGFGVFIASGKLWISWHEAAETKQKVDLMEKYIVNWNEKVREFNAEPYKAVKVEQIDDVQSSLILALKVNNLELTSFKNMTSANEKIAKAANGKSFEIDFKGSWKDTVHFLREFHVGNALLAIRNLIMHPEKDGSIKTTLQYKIYTK